MNILNEEANSFLLTQIDFHVNSISKLSSTSDVMNWFHQSSIHWMMGLFIMKYFCLSHDLSKQQLINEINKHIASDAKKTITTEFRYIEDCKSKKYITTDTSYADHRKKIVKPSQLMIDSFKQWFAVHSINKII